MRTHTLYCPHVHNRWKEQESYIDSLLSKLESSGASEVAKLKDSESKLQLQVQESTRREQDLKVNSPPTFILYGVTDHYCNVNTWLADSMHSDVLLC